MIDCDEKASKDNARNAIILKKWEGDPADRTLFDLIPFLLSECCYVSFIFLRGPLEAANTLKRGGGLNLILL